jgi:lipid II:glycine glycyltransferase (peptidoglycan interpeptide bridge formation enzyme)
VDRAAHLAFASGLAADADLGSGAVSFLQCPAWGELKEGWRPESVGWFRGSELVGTALVLYRALPRTRHCLAYVPEGPLIDWYGERTPYLLADWLLPFAAYLRGRGAFTAKIGPRVVTRSWSAATIKHAVADGGHNRLGDIPADTCDPRAERLLDEMRALGWRRPQARGAQNGGADGSRDFQPRYLYRLQLRGRDGPQLLAGFNQQWRRNIRVAERAGVKVVRAGAADLPEFHRLYLETAARAGFTPRPLDYFERMFRVFAQEGADRIRLYLARSDGRSLAAAVVVRLGSYAWCSHGASTADGRAVRPSNALHWRILRDCLAEGAHVYDLRGIGDTLDPEHHLFGLLRFKAGLGGEAVEYPGEWDLPINGVLHRAFQLYLARR